MKQATFVQHGQIEGQENWQTFNTPAYSRVMFDRAGNPRCAPFHSVLDVFDLLPAAAAAAGADAYMLSLGTGAEVIARSSKGGINVKTKASTPADNDNAMIIPVANCANIVPITAKSRPRFSTRISLTAITEIVASAGMDENITSPIPSGTAGDGAAFYFDPAGENSTGLDSDTLPNWILTQKVAGADTYIDSGVPVEAGRDYHLEIVWGEDLKPSYYIDGALVGTGVANTASASVSPLVGLQLNASSPSGQRDMDVRFVMVERFIG